MSRTLTEPLYQRLASLREGIALIGNLAARIEHLEPSEREVALRNVLEFLRGDLRLHAEAEELFLFPKLARRLRHPLGTAAMEFDHRLLREYADTLAAADPRDGLGLERLLYAIHTLLDSHFRKEEEVYLPLLEYEDSVEDVAYIEQAMARHETGQPQTQMLTPLDFERKEFPVGGSALSKLVFLLGYAVLAPSSHNSQPWRFRPDGDALLLSADRTRALPVVDPDDRELEISCGALLFHLEVAIRHHGYEALVDLLPDPGDPDLLARVSLGAERLPTREEKLLFWAIAGRRTNRHPFEPRPLPDGLLSVLVDAAEAEGAGLSILVTDAERTALAELVGEADRRQLEDESFRRELASWIHGRHGATGDGMPGESLGIPRLLTSVGPFTIRTFDLGKGVAAHDQKLVAASPVLAVLATGADGVSDRLAAGRALDHVLLRAAQDGVSASFLNQPVELPDLRPSVARLADHAGIAQIVLRLGYGPPVQPTPRRPVRDVLDAQA